MMRLFILNQPSLIPCSFPRGSSEADGVKAPLHKGQVGL